MSKQQGPVIGNYKIANQATVSVKISKRILNIQYFKEYSPIYSMEEIFLFG